MKLQIWFMAHAALFGAFCTDYVEAATFVQAVLYVSAWLVALLVATSVAHCYKLFD